MGHRTPATAFRNALLLALAGALAGALVATELPEVHHLTGEPDFRDVALRWEYASGAADVAGFQVRYCELQAWGPHRCRTKMVAGDSGREALRAEDGPMAGQERARTYSVTIGGLRMATNYSFEVRPVEARRARSEVLPTRVAGRSIVVPTKGFSARATQCLPHVSEVEVLTGPYFGGRIAVEAADGERCAVAGDPHSARDTYILRIDHDECGSHLNATTVATFVLVQENLPILTHSTRRFLVLCTYQPETLTVRAGINLPTHGSNDDTDNDNRVDQAHPEAIPYDASQLESVNDVQVSRLQHHRQIVEARTGDMIQEQSGAHLVLMVILVVAGVIGCIIAAWWFVPGVKRVTQGSHPSSGEPSTASVYENFENTLRDTISIAGTETSSSETDSIQGLEDCSQSHPEQDSCPSGVFTIRIPTPMTRQQRERSCITIEPTSHSEA